MLHFIKTSFIISFLLSSKPLLAEKSCHSIPEKTKPVEIETCTTKDTYSIKVMDRLATYPKKDFEASLQKKISDWLELNKVNLNLFCKGTINFWLSVPSASPGATRARIEVVSEYNNFLIFMSPYQEEWKIEDKNVSILEQEHYPKSLGYRVKTLLVKKKADVSKNDVDNFLMQYEIKPGEHVSGDWYSYKVKPFSENMHIHFINWHPKKSDYIENIQTNSSFEWVSDKGLAFSFPWQCQ